MTAKASRKRPRKDTYRLTIDPGVELGYAFWCENSWECKASPPESTGVIKSTLKTKNRPAEMNTKQWWGKRCDDVMRSFNQEVLMGAPGTITHAYIEEPTFMDNAGGQTSARSDSLVKLAIMAGRLIQAVSELNISVEQVPICNWKGTLSKEIVNARILRILTQKGLNYAGASVSKSHDWDAIGIGLHLKGSL